MKGKNNNRTRVDITNPAKPVVHKGGARKGHVYVDVKTERGAK